MMEKLFKIDDALRFVNDGTKYWLYVYGNSGAYDWMSSGVTPTGIATLTGNLFTSNGGVSDEE